MSGLTKEYETLSDIEPDTSPKEDLPPAIEAQAKPPRAARTKISKLAILALLVSLPALLASAYLYWLQYNDNTQHELTQAITLSKNLSQQLQRAQDQLTEQQDTLGRVTSRLNEAELQVRHNSNSAMNLNTRLAELAHTDRSDWQLAEVEYLLRLAHQRVLDTANAELGLELLFSADAILKEIAGADLYGIRQQIAADALALKNATTVDVEGLYSGLQAVSNTLHELALGDRDTTLAPAPETTTKGLSLSSLLEAVLSLYRVQSRDLSIAPLLDQEQRWAIEQRLLLLIEQAKQALISQSDVLYRSALTQAQALVQNYASDEDQKQVLMEQLDHYLEQNIVAQIPDISGSHAKMKRYINALRLQDLAAPPHVSESD